jgi:hypothetical protein
MSTKIDLHAAQAEITAENAKLLDVGYALPVLKDGKMSIISKQKRLTKAQSGKAV